MTDKPIIVEDQTSTPSESTNGIVLHESIRGQYYDSSTQAIIAKTIEDTLKDEKPTIEDVEQISETLVDHICEEVFPETEHVVESVSSEIARNFMKRKRTTEKSGTSTVNLTLSPQQAKQLILPFECSHEAQASLEGQSALWKSLARYQRYFNRKGNEEGAIFLGNSILKVVFCGTVLEHYEVSENTNAKSNKFELTFGIITNSGTESDYMTFTRKYKTHAEATDAIELIKGKTVSVTCSPYYVFDSDSIQTRIKKNEQKEDYTLTPEHYLNGNVSYTVYKVKVEQQYCSAKKRHETTKVLLNLIYDQVSGIYDSYPPQKTIKTQA